MNERSKSCEMKVCFVGPIMSSGPYFSAPPQNQIRLLVMTRLKKCAEVQRHLHDHGSVLKVLGLTVQEDCVILLLEQAEGSLRDIITPTTPGAEQLKHRVLATMSRGDLFRQFLHALTYVHSRTDEDDEAISHRDVKPENVLLTSNPRDATFVPKLSDFDSAKSLEVGGSANVSSYAYTEEYRDPFIDQKKDEGEDLF